MRGYMLGFLSASAIFFSLEAHASESVAQESKPIGAAPRTVQFLSRSFS